MKAMKKHYECAPNVWHKKTLIFDWDEETGEVTGPNAAEILDVASWGEIWAHPYPCTWKLSAEPTKSKTDMAAIIGYWHKLPDDLKDYYPKIWDGDGPDEDGVIY